MSPTQRVPPSIFAMATRPMSEPVERRRARVWSGALARRRNGVLILVRVVGANLLPKFSRFLALCSHC